MPPRSGKVVFSITLNLTDCAEALRKFGQACKTAAEALRAGRSALHRGDWWKRSEPPPDWIADANEPEWWKDGDEPPPWGCAA